MAKTNNLVLMGECADPPCEQQDCQESGGCPDPGAYHAEDCGNLLACMLGMHAIVHLTFEDDEGRDDSELSGAYVFEPQCPGWSLSAAAQESFRRRAARVGMTFPEACDLSQYALGLSAQCTEEGMLVCVTWDSTNVDCQNETPRPSFQACAVKSLPTTLTNGLQLVLDDVVLSDDGPNLTAASVTFFGRPCGDCPPETCASGPIIDFTVDAIYCGNRIQATALPGVCPIVGCFWSDGSMAGCERNDVVSCEDGEIALTMYAFDEGGCKSEVTKDLACCDCPNLDAALQIDSCLDAEITEDPDIIECSFRFTADIDCVFEECEECRDGAFIEICKFDGPSEEWGCDECPTPFSGCTDCSGEDPADNPCHGATTGGCVALVHGSYFDWRLLTTNVLDKLTEDYCFRWRLWPCACGCPGPWNYFTIASGPGNTTECEP